jgi:hypothetical protein
MNNPPLVRPNPVPMNRVMIFILRSPLHRVMSKQLMVITMKGIKSGALISTPVSYIRRGSEVYVMTRSSWWKNLAGGKPVTLHIQGKEFSGQARVTDDPQAVSDHLRLVLKEQPINARFFHITFGPGGEPNPDELVAATKIAKLVKITI